MEGDRPRLLIPIGGERALGALAMAVICAISFANVVVRYAMDVSFAFTEEFSVFLLVFMTFIGVSLAFAQGDHLRIAFLVDHLPPRWRRAALVVSVLASLVMFSLVLYYGALLAFDEYRFEETSPGLGYPTWIYTMWMPILAVVIVLRIIGRLVATLRAGR